MLRGEGAYSRSMNHPERASYGSDSIFLCPQAGDSHPAITRLGRRGRGTHGSLVARRCIACTLDARVPPMRGCQCRKYLIWCPGPESNRHAGINRRGILRQGRAILGSNHEQLTAIAKSYLPTI